MSQLLEFVKGQKAKTKSLLLAGLVAAGSGVGGYTLWGGPKTITTAEAAAHVGKKVRQEVRVGSSRKFTEHALLNEGVFPKHTMTIRVLAEHPAFGSIPEGKNPLRGKTVVATGTMDTYEGKPQLVVGKGDTFEIK